MAALLIATQFCGHGCTDGLTTEHSFDFQATGRPKRFQSSHFPTIFSKQLK